MKKNRITTIVIIMLAIALAVSLWQNVRYVNERNRAKELLMSHVYGSFSLISSDLDGILSSIYDPTSYESNRMNIIRISNQLTMTHVLLSQYRSYYSDVNLDYGSTVRNFDFIAVTLTGSTGKEFNVLQSSEILEQDVRYLTALRDGIVKLRSAMEAPPQQTTIGPDKNLTTSRLSELLNEFFDKMQ